MDKLKGLLKSRKFWAAVVGLIVVVAKGVDPNFPIAEEQLTGLVVVLVGYIMGVALEDGLRAGTGSSGGNNG